ncbi:AfsR/SARP family transcriptional regulator [Mycolicibacterium rutilum]|uniref:AfsR/SARP family transcriptional regulator n=1 Tax=Mycolicibacterium rutilum TaxID=370526 RepID=UPI000A7EA8A1|nr:BTAD domain-containing putative transcriptional regulator [Mycolicibacterium rutilum]
MQFRVFGEVSAEVDGRRLEIGHARQRCVLAALVVDVNRPVSVEQLIDRVWADRPPARARNAVAGYLSRLRTLLAGGGVEIGRGPAGYTLVANEDAVDLLRFRRLAAAARTAGDPDEALALYQQALTVGCGEPFAGIATPWFDDMRNAIAAEHLSIFLDRNDAALRAGRHTEILGEVEAALQSHPLDERLAGQLMLTQFRCGRQAAALETYRRMRERLVDELGVDPGPALRAVHQQILDSEPADPVPPSRPPPPARAGSLPRRLTSFIGRADEVAAAAAAVRADHVITLTGVGGVGKTRLALEAAERCQDGFERGAVFCELAPVSDGAAVSSAVAAALGVHEKPGLGVAGTAVEHLRNRNMLLLIDNCEHVLDDAASLIERIARECPAVTLLATSREPLSIDGERVLPVRPLREREAAALFTARARAGRPEFDPDAEPVGAIAEICRRLDGLPLAIELAAARTRVMNSLDIARRLDGLRLLSGNARGAHPRQQSVAATIDWAYRLLAEAEQALFERLSVFAGSFDLEAVHGVCAEPDATEDDTLELLTCLVDKSMVVIRGGALLTRYAVRGARDATCLRSGAAAGQGFTGHLREAPRPVLRRHRRARPRGDARTRRSDVDRAARARRRGDHRLPGHREPAHRLRARGRRRRCRLRHAPGRVDG